MDTFLPIPPDTARSCILPAQLTAHGHEHVISHDREHLVLDILRYTPISTFVLDANLHVVHVSDSYCAVSSIDDRERLLGIHMMN